MSGFSKGLFTGVVVVAMSTGTTPAAPILDRTPAQTIVLDDLKGNTYLQSMFAVADNIDLSIDTDDATPITLVGSAAFFQTLDLFDPKIRQRLVRVFVRQDADVAAIVDALAGKTLDSQRVRDELRPLVIGHTVDTNDVDFATSVLSKLVILTSGGGAVLQLNSSSYFYSVAYHDNYTGSGRSYGASPHRKLLDASDRDYLFSLDSYFASTNPNVDGFYRTFFEFLTASDASGLSGLSAKGQTVFVDFATVYTAELERHEMVNLAPGSKPWEIDLAEVTLISAYGGKEGRVMSGGHLIEGSASTYYHSSASGSGGLGGGRPDFMALARAITAFELEHHPDLVNAVIALTPVTKGEQQSAVQGDVFRRVLLYLNRLEHQDAADTNAAAITEAMVALLRQVRMDAAEITTTIGT